MRLDGAEKHATFLKSWSIIAMRCGVSKENFSRENRLSPLPCRILLVSLSLSLVSACGSCQERCLRTSRRSIIQHSHEAKSKEKKTNGHGSQGRGLERGRRGMHGKQCALLPRTNLHTYTHTHTHTHISPFFERAATYQQGYLMVNEGRNSSRLG